MRRITHTSYAKILSAILLAVPAAASAVPASPYPIKAVQPDGTVIEIFKRGDERSHRIYSEDGHLIMRHSELGFVYAMVDESGLPAPSTVAVHPMDKRGQMETDFLSFLKTADIESAIAKENEVRKKLPSATKAMTASATRGMGLTSTNFPVFGEQKGLVILVEYQDLPYTQQDANNAITALLNKEGYSENGATGSARDWFIENSNGQFLPEFDVYGPVTLSNNRSYYGGNDRYGNDKHPEMMAIEACEKLDATVDFSQYDRDGDGFIDNVFIFYAGKGEADSYEEDAVWPHSWQITAATTKAYMFDGVRLDHYACSNEVKADGSFDGIGTFVHEFSHVMGLPDLYCTNGSSIPMTPGAWSVLDYGPYNNKGRTPPNYSAFERFALDWIQPKPISSTGDYTIENLSETNQAFIVYTEKESEYFLFENRQKRGNDAFLPGHGMLVWHVDYVKSVFDNNEVNNDPWHQYVDLVEADSSGASHNKAGDPFPGSTLNRKFGSSTKPALQSWDKNSLGVELTQVYENKDIITFHAEVEGSQNTVVGNVAGSSTEVYVKGSCIINCSEGSIPVYSISGALVGHVSQDAPLELDKGIYIAGGKKLLVR